MEVRTLVDHINLVAAIAAGNVVEASAIGRERAKIDLELLESALKQTALKQSALDRATLTARLSTLASPFATAQPSASGRDSSADHSSSEPS